MLDLPWPDESRLVTEWVAAERRRPFSFQVLALVIAWSCVPLSDTLVDPMIDLGIDEGDEALSTFLKLYRSGKASRRDQAIEMSPRVRDAPAPQITEPDKSC
jgi:hypothetical protein